MALKNRLYPHMMPEEIPIWERFLLKHGSDYNTFTYDVRVGTPVIVPPEVPANIKGDAQTLSLKRIDAIGWKLGKPTIIEVKKIIGFTTLGQAIAYPIMFAKTAKRRELPDILIVAENITPDMHEIFALVEIPYILI